MTRKSRRELEQDVDELSEATGSADAAGRPIFGSQNSDGDLVDEHGNEIERRPLFGIKEK